MPTGSPEANAMNGICIEVIVDDVLWVFCHSDLLHKLGLVMVDACKGTNVCKDILKSIHELEGDNIAKVVYELEGVDVAKVAHKLKGIGIAKMVHELEGVNIAEVVLDMGIEAIVDEVRQVFCHLDLLHELVLVMAHACKGTNMHEDVLRGVRQLEGINIARPVLDIGINIKLHHAQNLST